MSSYANRAGHGVIFLKTNVAQTKNIYILYEVYSIYKHFYRAQPLQYEF